MFSILGFRKSLFQHVYLLPARDARIFLTSTVTQANRTQRFVVTRVGGSHVFFHGPGSGLSIQAAFHFLSECRYRSRREGELQLFSKLNLFYVSPADQQRSQVSSSDKEKPSRQKLFPQSLTISKNLIPTATARFGFIIWTTLLSLLTSDFESLDLKKFHWIPHSYIKCRIFFLFRTTQNEFSFPRIENEQGS